MFHTSSIIFKDHNLYYISGSSLVYQKVSIDKRVSIKLIEKIELIPQPSYLLYQDVYNYFVDVLLFPSEKILKIIEKDEVLKGCKNLEAQISVISDILKNEMDKEVEIIENFKLEDLLSFNDDDFIEVYSKDELELDFVSRTELFYSKIRKINNNNQPTVILVRRDHLVFDTCKHFSVMKKEDFLKPMFVYFANEQGLDMGGVTREFYQLLSEQILDPTNCLFVKTGFNHTYHPNPNSSVNDTHLQYFLFIGRLLGKAIYDMNMMDTHFTRVLFKLIVGAKVTYDDLEFVDPSLYLGLNKLLQMEDPSILEMNFVSEENDFGSNNTYSLIENGEKLTVTNENKKKFVELYSKWKIVGSVKNQLEKILYGIYEIIPRKYFSIFNEKELELLLCGSPELDIKDWKKNTKLEGFDKDSMVIVDSFWEMVEEMNPIEQSKLLQFVTGTTCVPNEGFEGLYPPFTLCRLRVKDTFLPVAHTCLNRLDLPDYGSKKITKEKFIQALDLGLKEGFQLD